MAYNVQLKQKDGNSFKDIDPLTKAANVSITPAASTPSGVTDAQDLVDNLKSMAYADVTVTVEESGNNRIVTFN